MDEEMQNNKPTKKDKAVQAGSDIAEVAAKGAASYFGGPVGGALADQALNTEAGQAVVHQVGENLSKNPITRRALAKAQPRISKAKPIADMAMGSLAGDAGAEGAAAGVGGGIVQPTGTTGTETPNHMNGLPRNQSMQNNGLKRKSNLAALNENNHDDNPENAEETPPSETDEGNNDNSSSLAESPDNGESNPNNKNNLAKVSQTKKVINFLMTPGVLPTLGIISIIFIVILIFLGSNFSTNNRRMGLSGYQYAEVENLCTTISVYNPNTGTYTSDLDLETEYIPGVIGPEVGGFAGDPEFLRFFAIAIRTFVLVNANESCTITGTDARQVFEFDETKRAQYTSEESPYRQAADETYGLVFGRDNHIIETYFDAACYEGEDSNNYYLGYGSLTIGSLQKQAIPKSWAEDQSGLMYYINSSKRNNKLCYHNHGYGISTYGAYYLYKEKDYNKEQLMDYYYNGTAEIYSIYETIDFIQGGDLNYTSTTSNGANDQLNVTLREFLANKKSSVEDLNEYILGNIVSAGVSTREAAVAAAVSLVGGLYQNYHVRIPYTMCGQHGCEIPKVSTKDNVNHCGHTIYGADPEWGARISNNTDGNYHYNGYSYSRYGPDCSGFVSWILHNAGFSGTPCWDSLEAIHGYGTNKSLNGTRVGNPGDLIVSSGHVMFIVGVDDDEKLYYVAHASSGSNGTIISTVSFTNSIYKIVDMTDWYENHKRNISTNDFIKEYRDGYIDGYTGNTPNNVEKRLSKNELYFVGDSRTIGLCYYSSLCNDLYTCETSGCLAQSGSSYNWFKGKTSKINNVPNRTIIINMGGNDLAGTYNLADIDSIVKKYYDTYLELANNNPSKTFYIDSVDPVGPNDLITAEEVELFNSKMKNLIYNGNKTNLKYIDSTNAHQYTIGQDGIHYSGTTYKDHHDYLENLLTG